MRKELRPIHDDIACDVCGRTILKGERTEPFIAPGGERHTVCQLCLDRAQQEGWIRESAHNELPATGRRSEPRRSLFARLRRRRDPTEPALLDDYEPPPEPLLEQEPEPYGQELQSAEPPPPPPPRRRKDPRHVRAVPTNAQVKVERALELFNQSEHVRTIAGLGRTLGEPWVSAFPSAESASEVVIVVAWELSWYRFRVDLAEADQAVALAAKGHELQELPEAIRDWNSTALPDGRLAIGVRS